MKKSNKILLGGFLTIILVLVAVHVTLYARYKAGNYVPYSEKMSEEASGTQEFANARHIDIRHFKNVTVQIGDRMKVEQFGYDKDEIILTLNGNTVHMSPKDTVRDNNMYGYMLVYVPENSLITSYDAQLRLEGSSTKKINTLSFAATGGRVSLPETQNMVQIDSLNVVADRAVIDLNNSRIDKLSVQLKAAELIDQDAVINQLQLNADSASRINLQYKHLIKLTTKTTVHE